MQFISYAKRLVLYKAQALKSKTAKLPDLERLFSKLMQELHCPLSNLPSSAHGMSSIDKSCRATHSSKMHGNISKINNILLRVIIF